jgi:putative FmdB family regulatory protein
MPKYQFECTCGARFDRNLKIGGDHKTHLCPSCSKQAPRKWAGQTFGAAFAEGKVPGNSGISKLDYPTADNIVGRSAEARWAVIHERNQVKDKVREAAGTHALMRRHLVSEGAVEYEAMPKSGLEMRKKLTREANKATVTTESLPTKPPSQRG